MCVYKYACVYTYICFCVACAYIWGCIWSCVCMGYILVPIDFKCDGLSIFEHMSSTLYD